MSDIKPGNLDSDPKKGENILEDDADNIKAELESFKTLAEKLGPGSPNYPEDGKGTIGDLTKFHEDE